MSLGNLLLIGDRISLFTKLNLVIQKVLDEGILSSKYEGLMVNQLQLLILTGKI